MRYDLTNELTIPCVLDSSAAIPADCSTGTLTAADQLIVDSSFQRTSSTSRYDCTCDGYFASYKTCEFSTFLGRTNYTSVLTSLKTHSWLNADSSMVVFRFSCYNVLAQSHFIIQYLLELDKGGGAILVPSIRHALLNT